MLISTYDLFIGMIDMYLNGLNELDIIYFFEYPHSTGNCQNRYDSFNFLGIYV